MKRLTSLAEVDRALADVAARERAVDARLQTLLGNRAELEAGLSAIEEDTKNVRLRLRKADNGGQNREELGSERQDALEPFD